MRPKTILRLRKFLAIHLLSAPTTPMIAVALSALSLFVVSRFHVRFSGDAARMLADMCLLIAPAVLLLIRMK